MKQTAFLTVLFLALTTSDGLLAQYGQGGGTSTGDASFRWNLTGNSPRTDSLRFVQGSNVTMSQSGNALTISASGGGSVSAPTIRSYVGWTSDGSVTRDTITAQYSLYNNARLGIGGTTAGQNSRARLNVLNRSLSDTLFAFIGDRNGTIGDSTIWADQQGRVVIKNGFYAGGYALAVGGNGLITSVIDLGSGTGYITNYSSGGFLTWYGGGAYGGGYSWSGNNGNKTYKAWWYTTGGGTDTVAALIYSGSPGYFIVGNKIKPTVQHQAIMTVRRNAASDTLFMVRNDGNATLDSTLAVLPDGTLKVPAIVAGSNSFSGTATTDTVTVNGGTTSDLYFIQLTGASAPATSDACKVEARSGSFVVHRGAIGTSDLTYNWWRVRP